MKVVVNGTVRQLDAGTNVERLVEQWSRTTTGVAVAVNEAVVTRSEWATTPLSDGDRVEILTAVQGG